MAAQIQLANTFNEFRTAYNDAANDISTLQSANTTLFNGVANLRANTVQLEDLNISGGRVLISRAPISGSGALIDDDAEFTYDVTTNRLSVGGSIDANGAIRSANVTANNLTTGRVVLATTGGLLTDDSGLLFNTSTNELTVSGPFTTTGAFNGTSIDATGTLRAANVTANNLTSGRVAIVGTSGIVTDDAELTYNSATNVLSVINVTASAWANAANIQVSANVSAGDTVNAASHLHVGGVTQWLAAKDEDQDIHLVTAVAESDGAHDIAIVNRSNSANAYAEFIAINNAGNTENGWISLGINATNYDQGAFAVTKGEDAYILYQAPAGSTKNGDLVIGTGGNGTTNRIIFSANGFDDPANNTQMTIDPGVRIHIEVPTQSTSTTTGALTVAGGIGVVGNMNVGGNVTITGSISLLGAGNTVSTDTLSVANAMLFLANGNSGDSIDIGVIGEYTAGTKKYLGFVRDASDGIFKLFIDASAKPSNTVNFGLAGLNYATAKVGEIEASNTTATSSTTTGSLRVAGGAGIAGGVWAGGTIRTDSSTVSTSTSTGALIIAGGAGIAGAINAGGIIKTTDSTTSTSTSTGALIVVGGLGVGGSINYGVLSKGGSIHATGSGTSQTFFNVADKGIYAGPPITDGVTGWGIDAGQVIGVKADANTYHAIGLAGDKGLLYFARTKDGVNTMNSWMTVDKFHNVALFSTNTSISTTTGALTVPGGVGISGNTHVGGDLNVTGSIIANEIVEGVTDVAVSTNTYNVDYNNGNIFYATSAPSSGDFTLALTNVPTTNGRVTSLTLILPQGATARRPSGNAISINGTPTLVNFVGGNSSYTPTASKTDIFTFTILRRSSAFTVAGSVSANTVL